MKWKRSRGTSQKPVTSDSDDMDGSRSDEGNKFAGESSNNLAKQEVQRHALNKRIHGLDPRSLRKTLLGGLGYNLCWGLCF